MPTGVAHRRDTLLEDSLAHRRRDVDRLEQTPGVGVDVVLHE